MRHTQTTQLYSPSEGSGSMSASSHAFGSSSSESPPPKLSIGPPPFFLSLLLFFLFFLAASSSFSVTGGGVSGSLTAQANAKDTHVRGDCTQHTRQHARNTRERIHTGTHTHTHTHIHIYTKTQHSCQQHTHQQTQTATKHHTYHKYVKSTHQLWHPPVAALAPAHCALDQHSIHVLFLNLQSKHLLLDPSRSFPH